MKLTDMMWQALACTTKDEADAWLDKMVAELLAADPNLIREKTRAVVLDNIGYYTGYIGREKAAVILDIFNTRHPYFGAIEDWPETPEQIMAMGYKAAMETLPDGPEKLGRAIRGEQIFGSAWKP